MNMYYTKITHHLLSKVEKYILKEYIIYSIFQRCTKKLNRLVLCACVRNNALAGDKDLISENIISYTNQAICRNFVVHHNI